MKLTFSAPIFAANTETRKLTGQIVPWGQAGNTSAGAVVFTAGAFGEIEPKQIKLLLEHDGTKPLGRMASLEPTPTGLNASFDVARTTAGNDVLVEASEGLRDGLSIGANILEFSYVENVMHVTSAQLVEVSVVTNPAFDAARISEVKSSETDSAETLEADEETPETKEETVVELETTPAVAEVEAASLVEASAPVYAAQVRKLDANDLTAACVMAARGDSRAMATLTAALDGATTITSPGNIPVSYLTDIFSIINNERSFINSVARGSLPASGTSFKKSRWALNSFPSVGVHVEGEEIASSPAVMEHYDVTINPRMGGNKVSVELIDRSSPEYLGNLRAALADAYAINTDSSALVEFLDTVGAATGTGYAAIVDAIQKIYSAVNRKPNRLLVSPDQWAAIMTLTDEAGRPLFSPISPSNAAGVVDAFSGQILGLAIVVDSHAPSGTAVVYTDRAVTYYEAAGSPASLEAMKISTAEVEVAVKGYDALSLDFVYEVEEGVFENLGAVAVTIA